MRGRCHPHRPGEGEEEGARVWALQQVSEVEALDPDHRAVHSRGTNWICPRSLLRRKPSGLVSHSSPVLLQPGT